MAFQRLVEVSIGPAGQVGTLLTNIRIYFEINKTEKDSTNKATIKLYNLSEETITKVAKTGNKIILRAGYEDEGLKSLFFGDIQRAITEKKDTEKILTIEAYDGLKNSVNNNISISYIAGTPANKVLDDVIKIFNYPLASNPVLPNSQYANGYAFIGKVKDALTEVTSYLGKIWTIQNEQLVILSPGEIIQRTGLLLSKNTGLIERPELLNDADEVQDNEKVRKRYRVKSLLFPQIVPGAEIALESEEVNGNFKVESVNFSGDNWVGASYTTDAEVVAL